MVSYDAASLLAGALELAVSGGELQSLNAVWTVETPCKHPFN